MESEITSAAIQRLLGVNRTALNDLAKRSIVMRGSKRGTYDLEASVSGYSEHLREMAAGRGGDAGADARARLGAAQATLAETKAKQLSGELVEASEVEAKWSSTCRAIRTRVLAVSDRMRGLPARQHGRLVHELRDALNTLAQTGGGR